MQEKKNPIKRLVERMRRDKKTEYLVYGAAVALALLLYFSGGGCKTPGADGNKTPAATAAAEASLERRLTEVLSAIRGAGNVRVLITYETAGEIVPAMAVTRDTSTQQGAGTESTQVREVSEPYAVTGDGGETAVVLKQVEPVVRGVVVVAEGAADPVVRMMLQRAVQAAAGVSAAQVEVFEMTGQE